MAKGLKHDLLYVFLPKYALLPRWLPCASKDGITYHNAHNGIFLI